MIVQTVLPQFQKIVWLWRLEMNKPIGVMDYRYDEGGRYRKEFICPCLNLHTGTDSLSGQCFVIEKDVKNNTQNEKKF